ncbi:hypothetical protein [Pedobacter chitinilyticus]|uniref:Uncharacterized protein n=1 Tax=Pedobacter chitinilyticus TaxID=2233776 RepID=A0A443Z073_9SPHI|nr:hypothetical protein [Pedobacter chitinilyticus]RWU09884.1 hypothetical protein DPV69_00620 [Pedobacter chitinilyticus]
MEELIKIPYPDFKFSDYIKRKAEGFCLLELRDGFAYRPKEDISSIRDTLYEISRTQDKIQFIAFIITHLTEGLKKHILKCKVATCQAEQMTQDVLYYLYTELDYLGLETDIESFTKEELYRNNEIIDEIIYSLKELKAGQDIIFTEIEEKLIDTTIEELDYSKGIQVIGKSKWFKFIGGTVLEFAANKLLEGFFKNTFIPLVAKFGDVIKFLNN